MEAEAQPALPAVTPSGHLGTEDFLREPVSARAARKWAHGLLLWLDADALYGVDVMVSELVTNAYRHTRTAAIRVRVTCTNDVLKVEVTDDGSGDWDATDPEHEGGRGLDIVKELSDGWGRNRSWGNTVWFEMKTAGCHV